jgi:hypothetical protein
VNDFSQVRLAIADPAVVFLRRIQILLGVIFLWLLASHGDDHSMFPCESKFFDF